MILITFQSFYVTSQFFFFFFVFLILASFLPNEAEIFMSIPLTMTTCHFFLIINNHEFLLAEIISIEVQIRIFVVTP